jgi:hypothetical protein
VVVTEALASATSWRPVARFRLGIVAALVVASSACAACSSPATNAARPSGKISVAILSRLGPFGPDKVVAEDTLADLRATMGCGAPGSRCWPGVQEVPKDLLLAITVQDCAPVASVTGVLRDEQNLLISINRSSSPIEACAAGSPMLWLLGVPLGELPQHVLLSIDADGGDPDGIRDVTTSIRLPATANGAVPEYPAGLVASVTPPGWVPVDYGDAQVSVPAVWNVDYNTSCPAPAMPGAIYLGDIGSGKCPFNRATVPMVTVVPRLPGSYPPLSPPPETTINGIAVWGRAQLDGDGIFQVPELDVTITIGGRGADAVLMTLTHSPADVALAQGPDPAIPRLWKWVRGGDIQVAVPGGWPTTTGNVEGPMCGAGIVLQGPNEVVLDSDQYTGPVSCPFISGRSTPLTPVNGLLIDLHPNVATHWPPGYGAKRYCLEVHGLMACPYDPTPLTMDEQLAEAEILFLQVPVPGHATEMLEIGLAGNGLVARTILYSLRAA